MPANAIEQQFGGTHAYQYSDQVSHVMLSSAVILSLKDGIALLMKSVADRTKWCNITFKGKKRHPSFALIQTLLDKSKVK